MPYPLQTSGIKRFLAANGHTSPATEYAGWCYLHQGCIHLYENDLSGLESKEEWTRAELLDRVTDAEYAIDAIMEWVEKNPETPAKEYRICELPLLTVLTAINERYPLPRSETFKGNHSLMLVKGKINLLLWFENPNRPDDHRIQSHTIGDIGNDTLAELFHFIDLSIIPKPKPEVPEDKMLLVGLVDGKRTEVLVDRDYDDGHVESDHGDR